MHEMLFSFLRASVFSISLVYALSANQIPNPDIAPLNPTRHTHRNPNLTLSSLLIMPSSSKPSLTLPSIQCDGQSAIHPLQTASCLNAYDKISSGAEIFTLGNRKDGHFRVPLPFRWVSCRYNVSIDPVSCFMFPATTFWHLSMTTQATDRAITTLSGRTMHLRDIPTRLNDRRVRQL